MPTPSQPAGPGSSPVEPHRRFVEAAGHRLETCRYGPGDVPLRVVLLHEGLGSVSTWRDFPARLAEQLGEPVLAYSRPGYGQSTPGSEPRHPGSMHYDALVVLPALLGKLRINRPVLVGHSEGASIALIHAGTFRDESAGAAAGVAVMAPHLFVESTTVSEISNVRLTFESSGLLERLGKHHRDPLRTFSEWTDLWLSPAFQSWNIEQLVSEIRCPLLALHGRQDQYGTPRQVARLVELQPAAKALVLEDCRHSPHRDQPLAVLAALTGFLAGVGYVQEGPLPSAKSSAAGKPGDGPPGSG